VILNRPPLAFNVLGFIRRYKHMASKIFVLIALVLVATLPVMAHHPFTLEYDWTKPVTVTGTITKVDWANPHSHIYVDAKDPNGSMKKWTFELGSVNALTNAGWTKTTVKSGDTVTVDAWLSRSQSNMANVKSVKLSSGRELLGGSSIADPKATEQSKAKAY
jgi:Family of unknown function (DUF6152)